jgi:hypothetical protein
VGMKMMMMKKRMSPANTRRFVLTSSL